VGEPAGALIRLLNRETNVDSPCGCQADFVLARCRR